MVLQADVEGYYNRTGYLLPVRGGNQQSSDVHVCSRV
jgi:hypothetical protein